MSTTACIPELEPYCLLRTSLSLFQKTPSELNDEEMTSANKQAKIEFDIETRVLNSPEAASVIITDEALDNAVKQVRERFTDKEAFEEELENNGLDMNSLRTALKRQCKVENIMEIIAARAATISDVEIGIYYHMHPEKFHRTEHRTARHILITINADFAENTRENVEKRMQEIAQRLQSKPHKFADLALKHSECPTALEGGQLGTFPKGKLYPEIDAALFSMKTGQISDIIETEAGLHLVLCEQIHAAESISLKKAQPKIRKLMQERARRNCQRAWLASLPSPSSPAL